jgi:hypothetical protein
MNTIKFIVLLLILIFYCSCDTQTTEIINNQNHILLLCKDKSFGFYRSCFLQTAKDTLINEYFFEINDKTKPLTIKLLRKNIQFSPDNIIGIDTNNNEKICNFVFILKKEINSFGIEEFAWHSDDGKLTLYLNGKIIEYIPIGNVNKKFYRHIKGNWYLRKK